MRASHPRGPSCPLLCTRVVIGGSTSSTSTTWVARLIDVLVPGLVQIFVLFKQWVFARGITENQTKTSTAHMTPNIIGIQQRQCLLSSIDFWQLLLLVCSGSLWSVAPSELASQPASQPATGLA